VPYVPNLTTPLRLAPCLHLQIRNKQIMWARIITLQRTIHTPTLTMQGGETTPIFHGVTIRMCRIHKGSKGISQQGNNYQAPPQAVQPNPEPKKNDLESALLQFMTAQQQSNTQTSQAIQNIGGHYKSSYPKIGNTSGAVGQRIK
jgi:hypothetical protein